MSKKAITIISIILAFTTVIFAGLFILEATDVIHLFNNVESEDIETDDVKTKVEENDTIEETYEIKEGSVITFEANVENPTKEQMETVTNMMRVRLDGLGYYEAKVRRLGKKRITVTIPSVSDPDSAAASLGATAQLEFLDAQGNVVLTGADVRTASAQYGQLSELGGKENYVELTLTADGREKFKTATENAVALKATGENYIAIMMDDTILSMPAVQETIDSDTCVISGGFTKESAKALAANIRSGQLPFSLIHISTDTFSSADK